jgi:hypothetical protein
VPSPFFSGVRVTRSLVLHVCVVNRFVLFRLAIVLSVLLRFKDSDHPFGIFILFLLAKRNETKSNKTKGNRTKRSEAKCNVVSFRFV